MSTTTTVKSEVFFAGSVDRKISSTFDIPGSDRKPTWKMRSFKNPLQCAALVQTQVISLPPAFAINYKAGLISCLFAESCRTCENFLSCCILCFRLSFGHSSWEQSHSRYDMPDMLMGCTTEEVHIKNTDI